MAKNAAAKTRKGKSTPPAATPPAPTPEARRAAPRVKPDILDKSRPYGIISPPDQGACFSQGGKFYDNQGVRVPTTYDKAPPPPRAAAAPIEDDEDDETVEQIIEDDEDEDAEAIVGDINLTAWGRKQERYRFAAVREAIQQRFSRVVINESEAIDCLIEEHVITPHEARSAGWVLGNQ